VQAVKDEYQVTLVGHSLGAGAAALLAMMLRAKGITNMHCYAFAPPMCCEPDLAASCSDHVTSIVFRDDIIARYQPRLHANNMTFIDHDWREQQLTCQCWTFSGPKGRKELMCLLYQLSRFVPRFLHCLCAHVTKAHM